MSKTILLVDDEPQILAVLKATLVRRTHNVVTAENAKDGLALVRSHKPDMIVLDIGMPGMGGISFLREISDERGNPVCPVLVFSGRTEMKSFFSNLNVAGFVCKGDSIEDLLNNIERILIEADAARRVVLIAEPDPVLASTLSANLMELRLNSLKVANGADALETVILKHPDMLLIRASAPEMTADAVVDVVARMPRLRNMKIVVYEAGEKAHKSMLGTPGEEKSVVTYVDTLSPLLITSAVASAFRLRDYLPGRELFGESALPA